jgi:hypothetical protein
LVRSKVLFNLNVHALVHSCTNREANRQHFEHVVNAFPSPLSLVLVTKTISVLAPRIARCWDEFCWRTQDPPHQHFVESFFATFFIFTFNSSRILDRVAPRASQSTTLLM